MDATTETPYLSAEELARRWAMHRDTVYKLPVGELPYLKLGPNTRRYRLQDVEAYEQAKTVG